MIRKLLLPMLGLMAIYSSCTKEVSNPPATPYKLSYGDSILYVKNLATDYIVGPTEVRANGEYIGFPEGVEIDPKTGAINVSKSETGLRYRISFIDNTTKDTTSIILMISGINYFDQIYNLANNDTIAKSVYNATPGRTIPSGSSFDEGNGCNGVGVSVNIDDANINLAQTIRNGVFGNTPRNGSIKEVELKYRANDGSGKSLNSLKVKLYYYDTNADIPADLMQLLEDRKGTIFGANPIATGFGNEIISGAAGTGGTSGYARPRPPCIFIVGR